MYQGRGLCATAWSDNDCTIETVLVDKSGMPVPGPGGDWGIPAAIAHRAAGAAGSILFRQVL